MQKAYEKNAMLFLKTALVHCNNSFPVKEKEVSCTAPGETIATKM
jgi:hypothetical protein